MSNSSLHADQIWDIRAVIYKNRDLLESFHAGIYTAYPFALNDRIDILGACSGLLEKTSPTAYTMCPRFKNVLDDVLGGRDFCELTIKDCGRIAMDYESWLPLPFSGWERAISQTRRPC